MPPGFSTWKNAIFVDSLIPKASSHGWQRLEETVISLGFHVVFVVALIIAPLYFTQSLDLRQFRATFLIQPAVPPPPPPPAAPRLIRAQPRTMFLKGTLLAPTAIPRTIAMVHEKASDIPPRRSFRRCCGRRPRRHARWIDRRRTRRYPGRHPQCGGRCCATACCRAEKAAANRGGNVKPPRQIFAPRLDFPILAKQAGVQGRVVIDAIIDDHGNVVELHVVSGQPLLIPAALQNVSQWKYEPTYLNGEPISLAMVVNVDFKLGR